MLPIFSLWRSGNITEEVANNLFGPLLVGLAAQTWIRYIGVVFLILSTGTLLYSINKRRTVEKNLKDIVLESKKEETSLASSSSPSSGLGISLQ